MLGAHKKPATLRRRVQKLMRRIWRSTRFNLGFFNHYFPARLLFGNEGRIFSG